jgi:sugar phosphate isomerase/epimerase
MTLGMPTLIELKTLDENIALCRTLGLDFIELNMCLPQYQNLKQLTKPQGIFYTVHLDENLNPCDFSHRITQASIDIMLDTIAAAKQLDIPVLNMHLHSGVHFTLPNKKVFLYDEFEVEYLHKLAAFRDACTAAIGNANIKICVENGYGRAAFAQKSLDTLLQSPAFALTFDIGHNAADAFADEPLILQRISRLHHMHIHDARGQSNHLVLGEGELDLAKYLTIAKQYHCRCVLEVKTVEGLRKSVQWLKEQK